MNFNQTLFIAASVFALGVAPSLAGEITKQQVSFFTSGVPEGRGSVYLMTDEGKFTEHLLGGGNASPAIQVANQDGEIHIYDQPVPGPDGPGKYPLLGKIKASPAASQLMVILAGEKSADGVEKFSGLAFPNSTKDLPPGSMKLANLSEFKVKGVFGDSEQLFKPESVETIKLDGEPGAMISVLFQYELNEKWRRMIASQWAISDSERVVVIAYKGPVGNVLIKSVPLLEE